MEIIINRTVTVKQLAEKAKRSQNAIRMALKHGVIERVPCRDRKVLFELVPTLKALGVSVEVHVSAGSKAIF